MQLKDYNKTMSQIVTMPQLGETVTEGTVLRWLVKVTAPNTHIPFAPVLEDAFIPNASKVVNAIKELQ